jgi:methionyl-tRNA formyltransferase
MRIAFMGTPDFAALALAALLDAGHDIAAVYSQPPRPAGRGQKPRSSAVQALAEQSDLPVRAPLGLREPSEQAAFASLNLDVAVIAAYGLILPPAILEAPRLGCLNIHASLLPRWRGAAPIQRAILAGDRETGITIMQMDRGLDTGAILLSERSAITASDTGGSLHDRLAAIGAGLIVTALNRLENGQLVPRPQPAEGVAYAAKLTREEARLDWRQPAGDLQRQVRAFSPAPAAWCEMAGERIKVLEAEIDEGSDDSRALPGTVLDDRLTIACGRSALRLLTVQRPGKAAMDSAALLRGFRLAVGSVLP